MTDESMDKRAATTCTTKTSCCKEISLRFQLDFFVDNRWLSQGMHRAAAPPQPQPLVRAENALGAARLDGEMLLKLRDNLEMRIRERMKTDQLKMITKWNPLNRTASTGG
ncbi:hypothetical protein IFM89_026094 [Coptis chinensis]|uniref:Uncharacterized protein n=1 Tax=Coptis chinensis TaxID=261450 RepID=A0A835HHJ4_9MAGN|nr:hypothetical protein IFM89_026094 [Coptis chinensis]